MHFAPKQTLFGAMFGWIDRLPPPFLADDPTCLLIDHQAAGHACLQPVLTGIPLKMTAPFTAFAGELCQHYEYWQSGWFGAQEVGQEDFLAYRERLARYGFRVGDRHKKWLMEALYPVEVPEGRFDLVTDDAADLERLQSLAALAVPRVDPPTVYLVADNSD